MATDWDEDAIINEIDSRLQDLEYELTYELTSYFEQEIIRLQKRIEVLENDIEILKDSINDRD